MKVRSAASGSALSLMTRNLVFRLILVSGQPVLWAVLSFLTRETLSSDFDLTSAMGDDGRKGENTGICFVIPFAGRFEGRDWTSIHPEGRRCCLPPGGVRGASVEGPRVPGSWGRGTNRGGPRRDLTAAGCLFLCTVPPGAASRHLLNNHKRNLLLKIYFY